MFKIKTYTIHCQCIFLIILSSFVVSQRPRPPEPPSQDFARFLFNPEAFMTDHPITTRDIAGTPATGPQTFDFKVNGMGQSLIIRRDIPGSGNHYWLNTKDELKIDITDLNQEVLIFTSDFGGCTLYTQFVEENGRTYLYTYHFYVYDNCKKPPYSPSGIDLTKSVSFNHDFYKNIPVEDLRDGFVETTTGVIYRNPTDCSWKILYQNLHYKLNLNPKKGESSVKHLAQTRFSTITLIGGVQHGVGSRRRRSPYSSCERIITTTSKVSTTAKETTSEMTTSTSVKLSTVKKPKDENSLDDGIGSGGGGGGGFCWWCLPGGVGGGGGGGGGNVDGGELDKGVGPTRHQSSVSTTSMERKSTTQNPLAFTNSTSKFMKDTTVTTLRPTTVLTTGFPSYSFCKQMPGFDITPGHDIGVVPGRVNDCCNICKRIKGCKAWVHNVSPQACYLKNEDKLVHLGGSMTAGIMYPGSSTTASPDKNELCLHWPGYDIAPGNDITAVSGHVNDCCDICKRTKGCKAWVHNIHPPACYLKNQEKLVYRGGSMTAGTMRSWRNLMSSRQIMNNPGIKFTSNIMFVLIVATAAIFLPN